MKDFKRGKDVGSMGHGWKGDFQFSFVSEIGAERGSEEAAPFSQVSGPPGGRSDTASEVWRMSAAATGSSVGRATTS